MFIRYKYHINSKLNFSESGARRMIFRYPNPSPTVEGPFLPHSSPEPVEGPFLLFSVSPFSPFPPVPSPPKDPFPLLRFSVSPFLPSPFLLFSLSPFLPFSLTYFFTHHPPIPSHPKPYLLHPLFLPSYNFITPIEQYQCPG